MLDDLGYIPTMVCVNHKTFAPCRHHKLNDPCHYTSEGATVELVRKYQQEDDND